MAGECKVTAGQVFNELGDTVTTKKLNDLGKPVVEVEDGAISLAKLAPGLELTADFLGENSVGAKQLATDAVDEDAILAKAVSDDKLADDAVTARAIEDGAVGTIAIEDGAVTGDKLAASLKASLPAVERIDKGGDWSAAEVWSPSLAQASAGIPPLVQVYANTSNTKELTLDAAGKLALEDFKNCGSETIATFKVSDGATGRFQNATPADLTLGAGGMMLKVAPGCRVEFGTEIRHIKSVASDKMTVELSATVVDGSAVTGIFGMAVSDGQLRPESTLGAGTDEAKPSLDAAGCVGLWPHQVTKDKLYYAFDADRDLLGKFANSELGGFNGYAASWKAGKVNALAVDLGTEKTIVTFRLFNYHDETSAGKAINLDYGIKQFVLYGTNDPDKWDAFADKETKTSIPLTGWDAIGGAPSAYAAARYDDTKEEEENWQEFSVATPKSYRYYAVKVLSNFKTSTGWWGFRRAMFMAGDVIAVNGQWMAATTSATGQLATGEAPTDCSDVTENENIVSGNLLRYAVNGIGATETAKNWKVWHAGAWRIIASNQIADHGVAGDEGKWYYQADAAGTWVKCSVEADERLCLAEAMKVANNQMPKATMLDINGGWASLTGAGTQLNLAVIAWPLDASCSLAGVEFNSPVFERLSDSGYSVKVTDGAGLILTNGATNVKSPRVVVVHG